MDPGVVIVIMLVLVSTAAGLAWLWLRGSQGFIAERVRIELEERLAQRQVERITFLAIQRMLDEARRHHPNP